MTDAELAILGLVAEQARYGYEIEQVIDQRDMRQWTEIGFSSIYYLLKKLEKVGWVRSRIEIDNQRGPARKVYELTPAGFTAWHQAILDALSTPRQHYDPFQLGLSSLPAVDQADALVALRYRSETLKQTLEHIRTRRDETRTSAPPHVDAMFDLSETLLAAELQWLERFIDRLGIPQEGEQHDGNQTGSQERS